MVQGIYGGTAMTINSPVHHATEYLRYLLNKSLQTEGMGDVEVVDEVNTPISADQIPAFMKNARVPPWETRTPVNETGFLQLKFTLGGHSMMAIMGTTIKGSDSVTHLPGKPTGGAVGGFFMVGPTTFLIMPADAPEKKQREMKVVADSIRMTPQFHLYINDLVDHLIKIKLGAVGAAQRYHDATFHERAMSQFNEQMHMKDAYSHAFCNYVSDQQDYKDQTGKTVTGPASYRYAYSDGHGNYLFNDNPTTDLRGVGDGNWKEMSKARIGE